LPTSAAELGLASFLHTPGRMAGPTKRIQAVDHAAGVKNRPGVAGASRGIHIDLANSAPAMKLGRGVRNRLEQLWNWKSALLSAVMRALVFLTINWTSGQKAAWMAMGVEFTYRILTSGFYGSLIQRFRLVEPAWKASLYVVLLLPALNQGLDLWVHWLNGTPKLAASVAASSVITVWAALFNLYAMRRGALVTGRDARPLAEDLRQLPALLADFTLLVPRLVMKGALAK